MSLLIMILPLIQYSLDSGTAPKNGAKLSILIDYTKFHPISFISYTISEKVKKTDVTEHHK